MKRRFLVLAVIAAFAALQVQAKAQSLGTAENFAVLGGSTVTNTGSSVVKGDLGVWPGLAITGFPPGTVVPPGTIHHGDAVAQQAQSDVTAAYNVLAGLACPPGPPPGGNDLTGIDLGGLTLTPGVYCFSASAQLTGVLTLDALGNGSAQFVFQIGSTLTTASNSSVLLTNGAQACKVFWQVGSSATLGTDTALVGNILALQSITLTTGANVSGRALARNGAVTMDTNDFIDGCVVINPQTLAALTVDNVISCPRTLGAHCAGNGVTGSAPCTVDGCGLGSCGPDGTPADALNSLDHNWLQSTATPLAADMGAAPVNTVFVFSAVDHGPVPEEGIESTVWGRDSCDISNFPVGWTMATLTTIYTKGWEDPVACQPGPNSDDFVGQYSFFGSGFQFIAVYANFSVSIFDTPTSGSPSNDDDPSTPGWQSSDNEVDAIGAPICQPGDVVADAGPDRTGYVGEQVCFDGSNSIGAGGIANFSWDFDGNGVIDATGTQACVSCQSASKGEVTLFLTNTCGCVDSDTAVFHCLPPRASASENGSLLYYSKIELKWSCTGVPQVCTPTQDTFISIVNDTSFKTYVQWFFVDGDAPLAAIPAAPGAPAERAHRGWFGKDCSILMTGDESAHMSLLTGIGNFGTGATGCFPFTNLDPGSPPGRPDPDGPTGARILRGYAVAWAINAAGQPTDHNHLSGHATLVNYANRSAWEYNTYNFSCVENKPLTDPPGLCGSDPVTVPPAPAITELLMDGVEYDFAYDQLLFNFYAVGSYAFSRPTSVYNPLHYPPSPPPALPVTLDTDLTLYPVSADFRTSGSNLNGPVVTSAVFDIWDENENSRTGLSRCITCWDQQLLSAYSPTNDFDIHNIGTDMGKARIDGRQDDACEKAGSCCCPQRCQYDLSDCSTVSIPPVVCPAFLGLPQTCGLFGCADPDCDPTDLVPDRDCSEDAALLGVSDKILTFGGLATGLTDAGMTLVGQGTEFAKLLAFQIRPSGTLVRDAELRTGQDLSDMENEGAELTPVVEPIRSQRRGLIPKE